MPEGHLHTLEKYLIRTACDVGLQVDKMEVFFFLCLSACEIISKWNQPPGVSEVDGEILIRDRILTFMSTCAVRHLLVEGGGQVSVKTTSPL